MSNWADLPGDLLHLILSKLFGEATHSFSLVCRPWNTVAEASPYHRLPCLMYYHQRTRLWKFYWYDAFYNKSFPELENAEIRCSKYGWLLMSRYGGALFFFDPSNSQKVGLPAGKVCHGYTSLSFFNPPTSPDCVVVGIKTPLCKAGVGVGICTLKRGEDKWGTREYHTEEGNFLVFLAPPVLHRGLIYFLSMKGDVATLDIKQRHFNVYSNCMRRRFKKRGVEMKEQYLVKVNGEEALYGVFVFNGERKVHVFRLSWHMKWHPVKGIEDKVLYLSHTSSFGDKAGITSLENTIRFPDFHGDVAAFHSLSDAKYHSLDGDYLDRNAYGLRRLHFAAWVMPLPRRENITQMSWL